MFITRICTQQISSRMASQSHLSSTPLAQVLNNIQLKLGVN